MMWMLAQKMSQDELLRSISSSMDGGNGGGSSGAGTIGLVLLAAIGVIVLLAIVSRLRQRSGTDRRLNHPGKLQREVTRKIGLKPAEMKKLRTLADEVDATSPVLLLLCPSLMSEAMRKRRSR